MAVRLSPASTTRRSTVNIAALREECNPPQPLTSSSWPSYHRPVAEPCERTNKAPLRSAPLNSFARTTPTTSPSGPTSEDGRGLFAPNPLALNVMFHEGIIGVSVKRKALCPCAESC
jgi:hypothetical protein